MIKLTLTQQEKIQLLAHLEWANNLAPIQINQVANFFEAFTAEADTVLLTEGQVNDMFCIICNGSIEIYKNKNNRQQLLFTLSQGKVIGEMSFFEEAPCSATAKVKAATTLLVMYQKNFANLCIQAPQIAQRICINFIKTLCQRLRNTTGALIENL